MWTQESESVYWLKIVYWRNLENVYSFSVEIYSERDGSGFPLAAVTEIDSAVTIRYLGGVVSIPGCRQMASVLKYAAAIAANIGAYKELLREGEKPEAKARRSCFGFWQPTADRDSRDVFTPCF